MESLPTGELWPSRVHSDTRVVLLPATSEVRLPADVRQKARNDRESGRTKANQLTNVCSRA